MMLYSHFLKLHHSIMKIYQHFKKVVTHIYFYTTTSNFCSVFCLFVLFFYFLHPSSFKLDPQLSVKTSEGNHSCKDLKSNLNFEVVKEILNRVHNKVLRLITNKISLLVI